tara:strand:- start:1292 stop:2359 length:1068 start_codon:yes stop_codon:yes gene_type:complete
MVRFTDPTTGKARRLSTGTKDYNEAKRRAPEIITGSSSRSSDFYSVSDALDDLWDSKWQHEKSGSKKSSEVEIVRRRWGKEPVETVTYRSVQDWNRDMRKAGLAPATINNRVSVLSSALQEAANLGHLENVPKLPRLTVRNKKTRFLSGEEEARLKTAALSLNEIAKRPQGGGVPRYEGTGDVMILVMDALLLTGLRLGELIKSDPQDYDPNTKTLYLLNTKGGREIESIPAIDEAVRVLTELWAHPTWLAVTKDARADPRRLASARDWAIKRFTLIRNRAELPDVSLHTLRHTTASRLVQRGVDLYKVKDIMRHSTIAVTERYAHLRVDHLRSDMERLAPADEKVVPLRRRASR